MIQGDECAGRGFLCVSRRAHTAAPVLMFVGKLGAPLSGNGATPTAKWGTTGATAAAELLDELLLLLLLLLLSALPAAAAAATTGGGMMRP